MDGKNVKDCGRGWDMVEELREEIGKFKGEKKCGGMVVVWGGCSEI